MNRVKKFIYRLRYGFDIEARAQERLDVCARCKHNIYNAQTKQGFCNRNGIDIKILIYSTKLNPCPLGMWQDIDEDYTK
jgi:hypothetical protein